MGIGISEYDLAELAKRPGVESITVSKTLAERNASCVTNAKKPAQRNADCVTTQASRMILEVDVPIRLASEANAGGSLRAKISRKSAVKSAVAAALPIFGSGFPLPAVVTIWRMGGKLLDDDNAARSAKAVRDVVAKWLGCDDRDKRIKWKVRQRPAYTSSVRIRISHGE